MYTPVYTKQFEKDIKRCQRRGKDLEKFKLLARTLLAECKPDALHRDHKLTGNLIGRRNCHIESDWLLIYRIESDALIFERTGTHSDLFKK
ncbi:MAG: type II toxin-antitoxin system YafQ family toxin [Kiritimatiellae bacterium]|jgi:mRNA interferase YafQ|nr:type II toxin-antitoxin system YafQ family toxin [Kiritimatiellia bacterium]MDY0149461.1 type II toxin-antitoxin system YafQ family toxin [Kiritimatiellia bacterium]